MMNNVASESVDLASMRYLNERAIRDHALKCSVVCRGNRFTRVGEDFIEEVKADVEAFIRDLRLKSLTDVTPHAALPPEGIFLTGALLEKLEPILNQTVARIIQSKVQRQPSCGKTLGRTR